MVAGTILFATATYIVMVVSFYFARVRRFHMPVMATLIVIDLFFPVYLYMTRNWAKRLLEEGEIFSFLIWMHFILVITLYLLYVVQVQTARNILKGDDVSSRRDHRAQGIGILITKALVILTGALLAEPPSGAEI